MDKADDIQLANLCKRFNGIAVSGIDAKSLYPLIEEASNRLSEIIKPSGETEFERAAI